MKILFTRGDLLTAILAGHLMLSMAPAHAQAPAPLLVGVPVCDDFLAKYDQCLAKVGADANNAAMKASLQHTITQMRTSYKTMADNPATKPAVEQICKQSMEQIKAQLSVPPYNCSF
jgi:hypothetical protein